MPVNGGMSISGDWGDTKNGGDELRMGGMKVVAHYVASPHTTVFHNLGLVNMFGFEVVGCHTKMHQDVSHLKPENYYVPYIH